MASMFDVNSDETIKQKEMTKLIKDMYCLLKEEDPNLAAKDLVAKSAFTEMDADQDGKSTSAGFIAACLGEKAFSKMLALKVINIFDGEDKNLRNGQEGGGTSTGGFSEAWLHDDYDDKSYLLM